MALVEVHIKAACTRCLFNHLNYYHHRRVRIICRVLSLTQFATVFHLPAYSSTLHLSPSTLITIAEFSNEQAMSLVNHLLEPQGKS
jgi:hypothetical protein